MRRPTLWPFVLVFIYSSILEMFLLLLLLRLVHAVNAGSVCDCVYLYCKCGVPLYGQSCCGMSGENGKIMTCFDICPNTEQWKDAHEIGEARKAKYYDGCKSKESSVALRGPAPAQGRGPFAIAFSGGLRNFAQVWSTWETLVVEASGGIDNVDLYFFASTEHEVGDGEKLAHSLPNTRNIVLEDHGEWVKTTRKYMGGSGTPTLSVLEAADSINNHNSNPTLESNQWFNWRNAWRKVRGRMHSLR